MCFAAMDTIYVYVFCSDAALISLPIRKCDEFKMSGEIDKVLFETAWRRHQRPPLMSSRDRACTQEHQVSVGLRCVRGCDGKKQKEENLVRFPEERGEFQNSPQNGENFVLGRC